MNKYAIRQSNNVRFQISRVFFTGVETKSKIGQLDNNFKLFSLYEIYSKPRDATFISCSFKNAETNVHLPRGHQILKPVIQKDQFKKADVSTFFHEITYSGNKTKLGHRES